jgi:hypothetical protein
MRLFETTNRGLPFGFEVPDTSKVGGIRLRALIDAIMLGDQKTQALMRAGFAGDKGEFDRFVTAVDDLAAGDNGLAANGFAGLEAIDRWVVAATTLQALALAAAGEMRPAVAAANRTKDFVRASGRVAAPSYVADSALIKQGICALQQAEAAYPEATGKLEIAGLFRYVISYPRSGTTHLLQFLKYAFDTPSYSVYPAGSRYFSRRFYETAPGHAVFIKDHVLNPDYLNEGILAPVRDGRFSIVSLARYLYAEGSHGFVKRGELADFISFVAERMPYGFWGGHTNALLDARERGAQIRLVRYEEVVGNFPGLVALGRELAAGDPVPREDKAGYDAAEAAERRRLAHLPEWSEGVALPADSYIPSNWSIGGQTIDWHQAFDAPARRRFHELGGTEALIRLGYETDEDWWRQG